MIFCFHNIKRYVFQSEICLIANLDMSTNLFSICGLCKRLYACILEKHSQSLYEFQEAEKFPSILDGMEGEIQATKAELKELKAMHDDAQISKEAAQSELSKHEKVVLSERKQREIELTKMKKEAEEKKIQHERIERRIVSIVLHLHVCFSCHLCVS